MIEIVVYKTYVAIWFNYIGGKFEVRHSEMIEASSYSIAFGKARLINNNLNLFDYKCVVQKIDLSKIKPF
ncbi:MAG: hypothetical protein EGP82_01905 [Odoribacter splanchnicus]|nr:hypothetical protein [Odoribacter splanchnicus]